MLSVLPVESLGKDLLSLRVALLNAVKWINEGSARSCADVSSRHAACACAANANGSDVSSARPACAEFPSVHFVLWSTVEQAFARATGRSLNNVGVLRGAIRGLQSTFRQGFNSSSSDAAKPLHDSTDERIVLASNTIGTLGYRMLWQFAKQVRDRPWQLAAQNPRTHKLTPTRSLTVPNRRPRTHSL